MRKTIVAFLFVALVATFVVPALAQSDQPMKGPPPLLRIYREEVKPGMVGPHQAHEARWMQAFARAKYPTMMVTISSVTGPPEEWFMSGFGSMSEFVKDVAMFGSNPTYAAIDQQFGPKDSDYISSTRTITAEFRPDLSYHAGEMKLGDMRYFEVGMLRMKMGIDPAQASKMLNEARERGGVGGEVIAYEVTSGMPVGTFLFFSPYRNIEDMEKVGKAMNQAMGQQGWEKFMKVVASDTMNYEPRLFAINPRMSVVNKDVASADPSFWNPKPVMAAKPSGEVTPAAKKDTKK